MIAEIPSRVVINFCRDAFWNTPDDAGWRSVKALGRIFARVIIHITLIKKKNSWKASLMLVISELKFILEPSAMDVNKLNASRLDSQIPRFDFTLSENQKTRNSSHACSVWNMGERCAFAYSLLWWSLIILLGTRCQFSSCTLANIQQIFCSYSW